MNPLKYAQMIKYLTRAKKEKPDLPNVFPASKAPIPPKTQNVQEMEAVNEFMLRNPRVEKAGGGMLVQPSADGSRPGYAEATFNDPSAGIKVGDDLGQGISQVRVKDDGSITYRVYRGKVKGKVVDNRSVASYADAVAEREKYIPKKKGSPLSKKQIQNENKWKKANPNLNFDDLSQTVKSSIRKTGRTDLGTIGQGKGQTLLKGKDSPFFEPLSEKGEKIAKQVYGTTEVSDNIRQRINKGEITMDTKPVKFEKGKDISLKMKRGSDVVTGVEFPKETIDADGNIETAKQMEKRLEKFLKERVNFSKKGLTGTGYANADLAAEFPISEKQGGRLARYYINKLGLKYKEGPRDPGKATVTEKATEKLKVTSGIKDERRMTYLKTKILKERDLARKVDKAHRVSKSHMEKLGLTFDTNLVGMDSRIINQVILRPSEIKLNNLYARQRKVLDLLKENPNSMELKNRMTEINKGVKQIVKDTSGRLIGVTIDLDTLEPTFEGIKKKNTFTKFLGDNYKIADLSKFSDQELSKAIAKAVDAEAKRGFVPNDFKNILTNKNSQKSILEFAKKRAPDAIKDLKFAFKNPFSKKAMNLLSIPGFFIAGYQGAELAKQKGIGFDKEFEQTAAVGDAPIVEKGLSTEKKVAAGTAAAGAIGTKTGRNILKRLATGAFTPTGVALQTAGLGGLDLTSPAGRLSLGAELAFAPELVKASIGATKGMKNRALQKGIQQVLNLGLPTRLALRAARVASPIGIATLAGEGLYQAGKFSRDRIRELQAMSPEQRQQLRAEQSALAFEGARDGGLIGKKSGPPPISGPTPHGDEGLPAAFKNVRNL